MDNDFCNSGATLPLYFCTSTDPLLRARRQLRKKTVPLSAVMLIIHGHERDTAAKNHATPCRNRDDLDLRVKARARTSVTASIVSTAIETRMVQLPDATAAIEYVAACCRTRTRTRTKTKTKIVRGAYARSPQVQCVYEPSRLSVRSIVA